jgi:putative thioredoxin
MTQLAHVAEASRDNFDNLVLGNSAKGLVLVHYWTPKAGPCMLLTPRLIALAEAYGGRFLLVLANTDELARIAHAQGVTSVPTVKFYLAGAVVHTIHGAEPDATFRSALARYISNEDDRLRREALQAHQQGRTEDAITLLARAAVERPDDLNISLDLAKMLILAEQPERALDLLATLPAPARLDGRIAPLLVHLQLLESARNGPDDAEERLERDADDAEARFTVAARNLLDDAQDLAMGHFLHLTQSQPEYRDDIGRRALLALFVMLGPEHPLTREFRARLAAGVS